MCFSIQCCQKTIQQYGSALPEFPPGDTARLEPHRWEEYWEKVEAFILFSGIHRDHMGWLIATSAARGSKI